MADFYQTGVLATFHRLGALNQERLENDLAEFNRHRPLALVLPTTPKELDSPALRGILDVLKDIAYLNEIVVTLGRTDDPAHFRQVQQAPRASASAAQDRLGLGAAVSRSL